MRLPETLALGLTLAAGCETRDPAVAKIRGDVCLATFQASEGTVEEGFTLTVDGAIDPTLVQNDENPGEPVGYAEAFLASNLRDIESPVDLPALVHDQSLVGAAYEGTDPLANDPSEAWSVALQEDNPALYTVVDFTEGQESNVWDWENPRLVSISFFTHECSEIVTDVDGEVASSVEVWPGGVERD